MQKIADISRFVVKKGAVSWRAPTNVALVKYWGKKGYQSPGNPSVSMTLKRSCTTMVVAFQVEEENEGISLDFYFEEKREPAFHERIVEYLEMVAERYTFLKKLKLRIKSTNTFPHSAGIASSASSMSALALCLLSVEEKLFGKSREDAFVREASELARLASGSACRSLYGGYVVWGALANVEGSNDRFAIPVTGNIHPVFQEMHDAVMLVSTSKKPVLSRTGHAFMDTHPFAEARYRMAARNADQMVGALQQGDIETFIRITEQEALTLHSLMMSSSRPYLLIKPNTVKLIDLIRNFRKTTGVPVCFTLDAGPNVHILYPAEYQVRIKDWIGNELSPLLENGLWLDDEIGPGPVYLNK